MYRVVVHRVSSFLITSVSCATGCPIVPMGKTRVTPTASGANLARHSAANSCATPTTTAKKTRTRKTASSTARNTNACPVLDQDRQMSTK